MSYSKKGKAAACFAEAQSREDNSAVFDDRGPGAKIGPERILYRIF